MWSFQVERPVRCAPRTGALQPRVVCGCCPVRGGSAERHVEAVVVELEVGGTRPRAVAVVTTQSPVRGLIIEKLLGDSIATHGWGERLTVTAAGVEDGAGDLDETNAANLLRTGFELEMEQCPAVADDPELIEEADVFVCASSEEADVVMQWPQATGKKIYALTDFLGESGWACEDAGAELAMFIDQVSEAVPLLLRALVAMRS
jgi:protein-tyrosine-phosphatase